MDTVNRPPPTPEEQGKRTNDQSTVAFPYGDLDDAIAVAQALVNSGGFPCEADQLAVAMHQSPTSGAFRTKIATARTFGAIKTVSGKYELTDIGWALTDKTRERAARADAFLRVELYQKLYNEFRNRQLPPRPVALQRAFVQFGVAPKQAERARQAFDRSAKQAGFFEGGNERLIRPTVGSLSGPAAPEPADIDPFEGLDIESSGGGGASGGTGGRRPPSGLPPFIQGLLDTLPEPNTNWAVEGRAKWLQAAAHIFDLMYKGTGEITIRASEKVKATE